MRGMIVDKAAWLGLERGLDRKGNAAFTTAQEKDDFYRERHRSDHACPRILTGDACVRGSPPGMTPDVIRTGKEVKRNGLCPLAWEQRLSVGHRV